MANSVKYFGMLEKVVVIEDGVLNNTSAVSKSAICELRSATAGVINGSCSLKIEKKEMKQLTWGHALQKSSTVEPRNAKGAVKLYRYIEESLYRNSRYNDMALKITENIVISG